MSGVEPLSRAMAPVLCSDLRSLRQRLRRLSYLDSVLAWFFDFRPDIRVTGFFFFMALATGICSVCARTDVIMVCMTRLDIQSASPSFGGQSEKRQTPGSTAETGKQQTDKKETDKTPRDKGETDKELRFGYLYEMNAGFFYLVVAPLFVLSVIVLVRRVQTAFVHLCYSNRLAMKDAAGQVRDADPLVFIARCNRRWFPIPVLLLLLFVPLTIVVGTEFWPGGGDFSHVAFGYVQGPHIRGYYGKTLKELTESKRRINRMSDVKEGDYQYWKIENVTGGPLGAQRVWYWVFIVLALLLQGLFLGVVFWTLGKLLLLLWLFYVAFDNATRRRAGLTIRLDFEDPDSAFGLVEVTRAYSPLLILLTLGMFAKASSLVTNQTKGSVAYDALGFLGQGASALLPILTSALLIVYALLVYIKVDAARDQYALSLDHQRRNTDMFTDVLRHRRQLAVQQTLWPAIDFKTVTTVVAVLALLVKPDFISVLADVWHALLP